MPVSSAVRAGTQIGEAENELVYRTPFSAMESMFGVSSQSAPLAPAKSQRNWSGNRKTMLGRLESGESIGNWIFLWIFDFMTGD
jgi:hypothetical protein